MGMQGQMLRYFSEEKAESALFVLDLFAEKRGDTYLAQVRALEVP